MLRAMGHRYRGAKVEVTTAFDLPLGFLDALGRVETSFEQCSTTRAAAVCFFLTELFRPSSQLGLHHLAQVGFTFFCPLFQRCLRLMAPLRRVLDFGVFGPWGLPAGSQDLVQRTWYLLETGLTSLLVVEATCMKRSGGRQ